MSNILEKIQKTGFVTIDLRDGYPEYYNFIKNSLLKNQKTNVLDESFVTVRCDFSDKRPKEKLLDGYLEDNKDKINLYNSNINYYPLDDDPSKNTGYRYQTSLAFENHQDAIFYKDWLLSQSLGMISQIWLFTSPLQDTEISEFHHKIIKDIYQDSTEYIKLNQEGIINNNMNLTLYKKGCFLNKHQDGANPGNLCAILVYLNDEYSPEDGGYLILNESDITYPELGKCVIIDFTRNDIFHEVETYIGEYGRYAILDFISFRPNQ